MLTPNDRDMLAMTGSTLLREFRDEILRILAERNQYENPAGIVRDNVMITLEHRPGRQVPQLPLLSFTLAPARSDAAAGVMLNRESTRDHLWVAARWL